MKQNNDNDNEIAGPAMVCPTPPKKGEWSWIKSIHGDWRLASPTGREAAIVYSGSRTWFVFGPTGESGQNNEGTTIEEAKWGAEASAKLYWYENGWADPLGHQIRQGSRVRLTGDGPEGVVVDVYWSVPGHIGQALVTKVPSEGEEPKWEGDSMEWHRKYAPTGLYSLSELELLPPRDPVPFEDDNHAEVFVPEVP